jgi:hypothetical protein
MENLLCILAFIGFIILCKAYIRLQMYYWYKPKVDRHKNRRSLLNVTRPSTSDSECNDT